jgi:type II secretory pathway pseudopilin PulG
MRPSFRSGTLLISMSLTAACTTHITVIGPGPTTTAPGAVVASCQANAKSVETALEAYDTQMGAYPLADDWDALTTSQMGSHGSVGPWLKATPSTTHYVINFDGSGDVSVDKVGVTTYQAADNIDSRPDACTTNPS